MSHPCLIKQIAFAQNILLPVAFPDPSVSVVCSGDDVEVNSNVTVMVFAVGNTKFGKIGKNRKSRTSAR